MFGDALELLRSYGPSMAGWVFLLVFFAYVAGKGARAMVLNVKSLLDTSEDLRLRMKSALDDCEVQIARRDSIIRTLEEHAEKSVRAMQASSRELEQLRAKIHELTTELNLYRGRKHPRTVQGDQHGR